MVVGKLQSAWSKFWSTWKRVSPGISLANYILQVAISGTALIAVVIAWLATTWEWYWLTFKWAGLGFAFLTAWLVIAVCIFLTGSGVARWRQTQQIPPETTKVGDKIYPPTVTQSPPSLKAALYVGEVRLTFDKIKDDRYSELTMRVFNGTGRVIEFVNLSGQIKFNAPNNKDPSWMGELPTPALRPDTEKRVLQLREWFLILSQRVPGSDADKILEMLKTDTPILFDLGGLNIQIADHDKPNEIERLPLWSGVSYSRNAGFLRIVTASMNIKMG
jgi:hypothetical protein